MHRFSNIVSFWVILTVRLWSAERNSCRIRFTVKSIARTRTFVSMSNKIGKNLAKLIRGRERWTSQLWRVNIRSRNWNSFQRLKNYRNVWVCIARMISFIIGVAIRVPLKVHIWRRRVRFRRNWNIIRWNMRAYSADKNSRHVDVANEAHTISESWNWLKHFQVHDYSSIVFCFSKF